MHIALLGPLEVTSGHAPVLVSAPKERAVLEVLGLRSGRTTPAELLYEGLWGKAAPPSAAKALQTYVSHLRRLLPSGCISTTSGGNRLQGGSVDAARFEEAVAGAAERRAAGDAEGAAWRLSDGLALWRGRPCPELTEHSWATAEIARLEELLRDAAEELAELRLSMGEHGRLVGELEAAVAAEPLRERRWAQLMLAFYRCGRQADALRALASALRPSWQPWSSRSSSSLWRWNCGALLRRPLRGREDGASRARRAASLAGPTSGPNSAH